MYVYYFQLTIRIGGWWYSHPHRKFLGDASSHPHGWRLWQFRWL